jgi:hypothetical protein
MTARGRTSRQGYGWMHQQERKRWSRVVAMGDAVCARCGRPIIPGTPWDLGHVDGSGKTMYQGPEHRKCNRGVAPWLSPPDENGYRRPWSRDWGGGTPTSPEAAR